MGAPMNELEQLPARAAQNIKTIVLAEGQDARVVCAAAKVVERELAKVILIGNPNTIKAMAKAKQVDLRDCRLVDPQQHEQAEKYAGLLARTSKHKDMPHHKAVEKIRCPLTLAVCMVAGGDADGCVAGAVHTTADVIRAALHIVGMSPSNDLISSFFIMQHDLPHQAIRGAAIFADCAVVIDPDATQLAHIAITSADSAVAMLNLKPRVALLSFSTAGSSNHPKVAKVREAGAIIARQRPDIELMPEVQFDAAIIPEILRHKAPTMETNAPANVFIFPDLQSGNIGYKIAERIGRATAVGPILQGLKRPVNDLSRGSRMEDIVTLVAATAVQAQQSLPADR